MTLDVARTADTALLVRCYAVVGPGELCSTAARPGQVYCVTHLAEATTDRQIAEARLEQSRTAVLARAADNLDRMLETLVSIAIDPLEESQARIRAAARVLEVGGMLGPRRANGDVLTQVTVNVAGGGGSVTDADERLLALIERFGPEARAHAGALRGAIDTGVSP
jgi:hypothetical protein